MSNNLVVFIVILAYTIIGTGIIYFLGKCVRLKE